MNTMSLQLVYCCHQIAFADQQKDKASLEGISEKCAGLKNYDWYDNLKGETFRFVFSVTLGTL